MSIKFDKLVDGIKKDIGKISDFKNPKSKKSLILFILIISLYIFSNKVVYSFRVYGNFNNIFSFPVLSFKNDDLMYSAFITVIVYIYLSDKFINKKKFRKGEEYGSARFATKDEIRPFMDPDEDNNILLTKTEGLTMSQKALKGQDIFTARNKHILIVGGSGSGKTFSYVKPNILQAHSSYVITDPKGTLLFETGKFLRKKKYKIKVLNLKDFSETMRYNPFEYLKKEKDIFKFVKTLIANTKGEGDRSGDDFWVKAEELLYMALIALIIETAPKKEQNIVTLLELLNESNVSEEDENAKNPVDLIFEDIENGYFDEENLIQHEPNPNSFALRQYKKYKLAAGKTAKSILISCGARLAPFDIQEVREMFGGDDELELDKIGDRKTAFFVIIPDTDKSFNFICAMVYSQMFDLLVEKADIQYKGKLPVHVRCLLDEFANIGLIPSFEILIATLRSREISVNPIIQSKSQLKSIYKDNTGTIVGNCDTELFLGGTEADTLKDLSEFLGTQTIDNITTSSTKSQQNSTGVNYQNLGRDLMKKDEIATMPGDKCILRIRGVRPFYSDKYPTLEHKNYKYLYDANKNNFFNVADYISTLRGHQNISSEELIDIISKDDTQLLEINL